MRGRSSNIWSTAMHPSTSLDLTEFVLKLLSNLVFTDNLRHCLPPISGSASLRKRQLFVNGAVLINCERGSKSNELIRQVQEDWVGDSG